MAACERAFKSVIQQGNCSLVFLFPFINSEIMSVPLQETAYIGFTLKRKKKKRQQLHGLCWEHILKHPSDDDQSLLMSFWLIASIAEQNSFIFL